MSRDYLETSLSKTAKEFPKEFAKDLAIQSLNESYYYNTFREGETEWKPASERDLSKGPTSPPNLIKLDHTNGEAAGNSSGDRPDNGKDSTPQSQKKAGKGEYRLSPEDQKKVEKLLKQENPIADSINQFGSAMCIVSGKKFYEALREAFHANKVHVKSLTKNSPDDYATVDCGAQVTFTHPFKDTVLYKLHDDMTFDAYKKVIITLKKEWERSPQSNALSWFWSEPRIQNDDLDISLQKTFLKNEDIFVIMEPCISK